MPEQTKTEVEFQYYVVGCWLLPHGAAAGTNNTRSAIPIPVTWEANDDER